MPPPDRAGPDPVGQDNPPATLGEVLRQAIEALRQAGIEDPAAEARWLLADIAGITSVALIASPGQPVAAATATRVAAAVARRAAHEPLSRIVGHRAFYGRDFLLSRGTLDPRPDTETLIDLVVDIAREEARDARPLRIADIGTGTGAILITLLAELPHASGIGTDISEDALQTAARNAERLGVAPRARFERTDIREGLCTAGPERFDLIVSNPPYIATADLAGLDPEVRLHDPPAALDGGPDGLAYYRLLAAALGCLAPGGWLVVEVGAGQADEVAAIMVKSAPEAAVRTALDLAGHTRVVAIRPRLGASNE